MPDKPLRPCKHPGCGNLTRTGWCDKHQHQERKLQRPRASPNQRGYTYKWRQASKAYLTAHPWCAQCLREGRTTLATEVDHKQPHKGDLNLFWDMDNWQSLCHSCHSRKTAKEDGGYGHKEQSRVPPYHDKLVYVPQHHTAPHA